MRTTSVGLDSMATSNDLSRAGFDHSSVVATQLNVVHPEVPDGGPFCRLGVATSAPLAPGVHAWVVGDEVVYVGRASHLLHMVQGAQFARAYNDFTYVPPSKAANIHSPRVRVNRLLNSAIVAGREVTWWWRATESVVEADGLKSDLIHTWHPAWNRNLPRK